MINNTSPKPLDIFLEIISRFDSYLIVECLIKLLHSNPAECCKALHVYFKKSFDNFMISHLEIANGTQEKFNYSYQTYSDFDEIFETYFLNDIVKGAASAAPLEFVEQLLPWFIEVITVLQKKGDVDRYSSEHFFSYENYYYRLRAGNPQGKHNFIEALITAICHIARTDTAKFCLIALDLSKSDSVLTHIILMRAYISAPDAYPKDIFEYLIADKRRFVIGYQVNYSAQLFKIAILKGTPQEREQLENIVLELNFESEIRHRELGYVQFSLLKIVPSNLLTPKAYYRLQELERRFPKEESQPNLRMGEVTSPISATQIIKMNDENLLNAMRSYDESTGWDLPQNKSFSLDGGLVELSRVIGEQTQETPERFYNLTKQFDETIPVEYINQIMNGLASSSAPHEWLFEVAEKFSDRFIGQHRMGFCRALAKRANNNVPDILVDIMTQWALTDPNPDPSYIGISGFQNEWLNRGINSVRGVAVEAVTKCSLDSMPARPDKAMSLLEKAAFDTSPAVGACVLQSLSLFLNKDDKSNLTLELCNQILERHPQLLEDRFTYNFLNWATFYHFEIFSKHIELMLDNNLDYVIQEGARLATQSALRNDDAKALQQKVLAGDSIMRQGAAKTYSLYFRSLTTQWQQVSEQYLRELMYDSDEEVQRLVALTFNGLKTEHIDTYRSFIFDFLKSPSLIRETHYLIEYVKPLAISEHELALAVTESVVQALEEKRIEDFWNDDLISLSLAVYNRSFDELIKNRAMDLFERLLELGVRGAKNALKDWDEHRDWDRMWNMY